MGEVYRARDTRLKRDVALKVLPAAVAGDRERLARFQREAEVLASLNHPHIAAVYGIEFPADGGSHDVALVMELVEGEDLSARIARGAVPLDEALPLARQLADALQTAHERGIIHRDLKPANIKVRPDGTVKVLDFGLAKALDPMPDASGASIENSPTFTSPAMTQMGMIVGTAAYMAPEQAKGRAIDRRADVWAFGVVLLEMLTGARTFHGDDVTEVLASVLKDAPSLEALPADTPPSIRRLLRRCLQKDPVKRLDSMSAARLEIDDAVAEPDRAAVVHAVEAAPPLWRRAAPWTLAALAIVIAAGMGLASARSASPAAPLHVSTQAGFVGAFEDDLRPALAISPDGGTLVFAAADRAAGLQIRRLDQLTATPLPGTESGSGPFFSPDGQWIGYFVRGRMFKVPANGGAPVALADAQAGRGGTWGEDNVITYSPVAAPGGVLLRLPATGGTPVPLGAMTDGHVTQRWPQALPGNRAILYTGATTVDNFDDACLVVQTLDDAPPRVLQCGGSFWTYVASGHVMYVHAGTVFAAPFDLRSLTVTGVGIPVLEGVMSSAVSGVAQFAVTGSGQLAYIGGEASRGAEAPIDIVARDGTSARLAGNPVNWLSLAFSPDGRRLVMDLVTANKRNVWVYDLSREAMQRVTFGEVSDSQPIWTPDGRRITFASATGGPPNLYWQDVDGGAPARLTRSQLTHYPGGWSPDGRHLAFTEIRDGQGDIMILPMEGDARTGLKPGTPVPFLNSAARESQPAYSPDGKWLAYSSNESSQLQVYVTAADDPTRRWQVSTAGGTQPIWSGTRPELLFRLEGSGSQIFSVSYDTTDGAFRASKPAVWGPSRFLLRSANGDVSLHPDGNRIAGLLMASIPERESTQPHVVLVTRFFDELRATRWRGRR